MHKDRASRTKGIEGALWQVVREAARSSISMRQVLEMVLQINALKFFSISLGLSVVLKILTTG